MNFVTSFSIPTDNFVITLPAAEWIVNTPMYLFGFARKSGAKLTRMITESYYVFDAMSKILVNWIRGMGRNINTNFFHDPYCSEVLIILSDNDASALQKPCIQ